MSNEKLEEINRLFRKYKITKSEKKVFIELKKKASKELLLSDEEIICCLIAKKTFKKSFELCEKYSSVIEEYDFGRVELNEEHLEFLGKGFCWSDPRITGKNGEVVFFVQKSRIKMSAKNIVENEKMLMDAYFIFFNRLLMSSPNALRKGIIVVSDLRNLEMKLVFNREIWMMKKRTSPIMYKVPLRLKKYIIYHPPWYIKLVMKLVRTIISTKLQKRMIMTNKKEDLLEYVNGIPVEMGGDFEFDKMEGLRRILVKSEQDEKVFDSYLGKSRKQAEKKDDNNEEEEEEEEEEEGER